MLLARARMISVRRLAAVKVAVPFPIAHVLDVSVVRAARMNDGAQSRHMTTGTHASYGSLGTMATAPSETSAAGRLDVPPAIRSSALARLRMIGDPVLTTKCAEVDPLDPTVRMARLALHDTLAAFRAAHGFGRGIAANQIGYSMRMIAINMGGSRGPFTMHNPVLIHPSQETMTMWDDCFSFDCLMVRVRRHRDVGVRYIDEYGVTVELPSVGRAMAELLQHETDHLDGLTSFDRMLPGPGSVVHRAVYDANREHFDAMVDYSIAPTIVAGGAGAGAKPRPA